jgi:hypothetical protein
VARPNIESQAAPAVQGTLENHLQALAATLMLAVAATMSVFPGASLGMGAAGLWCRLRRPRLVTRIAAAVGGLALAYAFRSTTHPAWIWQDMLANALPASVKGIPISTGLSGLADESFVGLVLYEIIVGATNITQRSVGGQLRRDHHLDRQQWRAISGRTGPLERLQAMFQSDTQLHMDHQPGSIRLGMDNELNRPFDLVLPDELAKHVFLPGASGSGKTTTLARLADGALANWHGVIFIDCKAGDLGDTARALAARYGLPYYLVDPDDSESLGYNPCSGDAPSVANKLVGAFSYGANAEIYKNIAMEALPVAVRGLLASGADVTLETLYDVFGARGFARLAHNVGDDGDDRLRRRLRELAASDSDRVGRGGYSGLQRRIGALLEGKFGELFRADDALDWDEALSEPSVVYIALSTLASSEDVELFGRVIAQDLKQACARRLKGATSDATPFLAIFDEFAALREADQLADLLLQARQARMPTVISTQYIPETIELRKAALSAGLIAVHRVESEDAEAIAAQFGTRKRNEVTHQIDFETGYSEKGTAKRVDAYNVNPNILRNLSTGKVAIRSVARERFAIVDVYRESEA